MGMGRGMGMGMGMMVRSERSVACLIIAWLLFLISSKADGWMVNAIFWGFFSWRRKEVWKAELVTRSIRSMVMMYLGYLNRYARLI